MPSPEHERQLPLDGFVQEPLFTDTLQPAIDYYQPPVSREAYLGSIAGGIMQQIVAENPYMPEAQFQEQAYDLEATGRLPEDVTAWELCQHFYRFRSDGLAEGSM